VRYVGLPSLSRLVSDSPPTAVSDQASEDCKTSHVWVLRRGSPLVAVAETTTPQNMTLYNAISHSGVLRERGMVRRPLELTLIL